MFRGREMAHQDIGRDLMRKIADQLEEIAQVDSSMKMMGRFLTIVLSPKAKKK